MTTKLKPPHENEILTELERLKIQGEALAFVREKISTDLGEMSETLLDLRAENLKLQLIISKFKEQNKQ